MSPRFRKHAKLKFLCPRVGLYNLRIITEISHRIITSISKQQIKNNNIITFLPKYTKIKNNMVEITLQYLNFNKYNEINPIFHVSNNLKLKLYELNIIHNQKYSRGG